MFVVNKNLNPKEIRGKKYRSPAFSMSAIFSVPFLVVAIGLSSTIPPREDRGALIALLVIIWMALPVALLFGSRKVSYILGREKLYFFNSKVTRLKNENRKKLRRDRTCGNVDYSDIKDFRYISVEFEGYRRKKYIVPPRVVIIGDDFEVEIYAYKNLIKRIKELNSN